jgi:hypothetical protein
VYTKLLVKPTAAPAPALASDQSTPPAHAGVSIGSAAAAPEPLSSTSETTPAAPPTEVLEDQTPVSMEGGGEEEGEEEEGEEVELDVDEVMSGLKVNSPTLTLFFLISFVTLLSYICIITYFDCLLFS